ncbi:MAG: hypothetical protein WA607_07370 [Candidatus Sulfotelmatobacter sp.]
MKTLLFALLLSSSILLAQDSASGNSNQQTSKDSKGQVTLQGCVSRFGGDYILMKQNPAVTYQLEATGKIRLRHYLGQRVEAIGNESPTMSTSSDAMDKMGSAASVTLTVASIRTIDKDCTVRPAP